MTNCESIYQVMIEKEDDINFVEENVVELNIESEVQKKEDCS